MFILDCFDRDMIKNVLLSKRQLGTNHLSVGYESSQLWVRNVRGYEASVKIKNIIFGKLV